MFFGGFPFDNMHGGGPQMGRREVDNETMYKRLGVDKSATQDEIRKAFKKLAIKHHPDKGGDQEKFKEVCRAYEILSDADKRRSYDECGEDGVEMPNGGGGSGDGLFEMFFGGGGRSRGPAKGEDVVQKIHFTLEEFFQGATKKMAINRNRICEGCKGRGGPEDAVKICSDCGGKGMKVTIQRMGQMIRQSQGPCNTCRASGKVIADNRQCGDCSGKGLVKERKVLEVHLPRGAPDGHKIVFSGDADEIVGAIPGDVVFVCMEKPHQVFQRQGDDLYMQKTITLQEALCGCGFFVTTLDGDQRYIKSENVIKPDEILAVGDHGMTKGGSMFHRGNLFIKFSVVFPTSLTTTQKDTIARVLPGSRDRPVQVGDDVETHLLTYIDPAASAQAGRNAYDEDEDNAPGGVQCRQG